MNDKYRITDRENIYMGNREFTTFALFERVPHPVQGTAYEFVGKYRADGHDATKDECIEAAIDRIFADD